MTPHKRRYETLDKYAFHLAGTSTVILLGVITTLMWTSQALQRSDHDEFVKLNNTMSHVVGDIKEVKSNQKTQTKVISGIKLQVSRMCDRQNLYWDGHQIDCGE